MVSSSGKSTRSRLAICSGLHDWPTGGLAGGRGDGRSSGPAGPAPAPVGRGDHPGQAVLHVVAQRLVRGELGHLGPATAPFGMPLRGRGPVRRRVTASRGVAAKFPRDRRRRPAHPAGDLAHPQLLRAQDRDLLTLSQRQVPPRQRGQHDRRHPASLTEPPRPDRLRHASHDRRVLARHAASDRLPEPNPVLAPSSRRPAWRPYLAAHVVHLFGGHAPVHLGGGRLEDAASPSSSEPSCG